MLDVKIKSSLKEFMQLYIKELRKAETRAMVSTFNEIVKYTLPNTPKTVPTTKHLNKNPDFNYNKASASKVIPEMKENLKRLRARIKRDIIGDGKLKSGIPQARATHNGNIDPDTLEGKVYASFVVRKKDRRKNVKQVMPTNYTNDVKTLIKHIQKTTHMRKGKEVAYRTRAKGTSIIFIESANVAKDAANELVKGAGVLLTGWRNLEKKVMANREAKGATILDKILKDTKKAPQGMGSIQQVNDNVVMKATNPNVSKYDQRYQQRIVDDNIKLNLGKHLEREISFINTSKLRKQVREKTL